MGKNVLTMNDLLKNAVIDEDELLTLYYVDLALEEKMSIEDIKMSLNEGFEEVNNKFSKGIYSFAELKMAEIILQEAEDRLKV